MANLVCQMASVDKAFDGRPILANLDLAVACGEMVAVTGESGSGKTTLLNIIGLLERPDRGELRLFGQPAPTVGSRKATSLLRHKLGYLFQNFALIDGDSVDDNLKIAQAYAGGSREARRQARAAVLQAVDLPNMAKRRVYELSGGEQQRVAIARLMLKPCDLVLADEPTGSAGTGDIKTQEAARSNPSGRATS
jgi:putative ABC transport system ATP-binding protein